MAEGYIRFQSTDPVICFSEFLFFCLLFWASLSAILQPICCTETAVGPAELTGKIPTLVKCFASAKGTNYCIRLKWTLASRNQAQSTHRVAIATFWCTFHQMEKSSQLGGGGGARPPIFTISTLYQSRNRCHVQSCGVRSSWEAMQIHSFYFYSIAVTYKVVVYAPAERPCRYTPSISTLPPKCTLWGKVQRMTGWAPDCPQDISLLHIAHFIYLCNYNKIL